MRVETFIATRIVGVVEQQRVGGGLRNTNWVSGPISSVCSARPMKSSGATLAEHWMVPADQCFDDRRMVCAERQLRLVLHRQLLGFDRARELAQQADPPELASRSGAAEQLDAAAVALRPVHGDVGGAQQIGRRPTVHRREGDAHAGAHLQRKAVDVDRSGEAATQVLGHRCRLVVVADVGHQQRELVASQPGDHRTARCGAAELLGDPAQQPVADVVTEPVVDLLEAVEVQQDDRAAGRRVAVRAEEPFDVVGERPPVQQPA